MIDTPATTADADRDALLEQAAQALVAAERDSSPIAPLTTAIADLSVSEAYRIASLRTAAIGRATIGYKLGYTSAAMRVQMGVDEPNYGVLFEGSGGTGENVVAADALIHPLVEPEITFVMARDLVGPGVDRERAWEAVESVVASLEVVDTRYLSYKFKAADNISDNSSAARFVLGDRIARDDVGDLRSMAVTLERDGIVVDAGAGGDALGDPVLALAWLANELAKKGLYIRAGEIVMSGGLTKAHAANPGSRFSASFEGLGNVVAIF
jgi:2-keto-4-pentenoate hydratase